VRVLGGLSLAPRRGSSFGLNLLAWWLIYLDNWRGGTSRPWRRQVQDRLVALRQRQLLHPHDLVTSVPQRDDGDPHLSEGGVPEVSGDEPDLFQAFEARL